MKDSNISLEALRYRLLEVEEVPKLLPLLQQLNPNLAEEVLIARHQAMFGYNNHYCMGMFRGDILIGLSGLWITERLYSGKQVELDNVIIDASQQSQGLGKVFLAHLEQWAKEKGCLTVELNAYVQSNRAHKFYFKEGFKVLGFHFQKGI